jgi:hypothetical protein
MKTLGLLVVAVFAVASSAAAKQATLEGCVVAGTHPGSFLMTHVTEQSAPGDANRIPDVFYRLEHAGSLKSHVGHRVAVTGDVDVTDFDKAKIKMKVDPKHQLDTTLEIESEGGKVEAKMDSNSNSAAPTSGVVGEMKSKAEVPVLKLEVKSIRMISSSCN